MANLTKSLDALFISKVRIKSLKYFIFHPDAPIHLRAAVRELKEEINAVRRELTRLDEIGLLTSEVRGNRKYFALNFKHPLLEELTGIFHKTFGLGGEIMRNLKNLGDVKAAVLAGTYLKGTIPVGQAVDLLLVGNVDMSVVTTMVEEAQKKMNRELHYAVLSEHDFDLRKKRRDPFLVNLFLGSKLVLVGDLDELIS